MRDARPADLGDALHRRRAAREVDRHRLVLARHRERRRLPDLADELSQERLRELADVESVDDGVAELDEPDPEPIAAARRLVDVAVRGEGREEPRHRARVDADAPGELVGADLTAGGERVHDGERAGDGGNASGCLSGSGGHATVPPIVTCCCP